MNLKLAVTAIFVVLLRSSNAFPSNTSFQEDSAVTNLRSYLRIQSAHPSPETGYEQIIPWLRQQAEDLGLDFHYLQLEEPAYFALWMTWNGSDSSLQSVLLNSHMDVVAAEPEEKWTYPPYDAFKDAEGNIYGRGAVDMKSATVAELEAIRRLKDEGFQPLRNIHLSIMPDEELGGRKGMIPFVKTDAFRSLNVGIDIDEGFPTGVDNVVHIMHAEKTMWQFNITARGEASHASNLPHYTAGQRLQVVIDRLMEYRESEYDKQENQNATIDQLTTINLVRLGGGTADNIIPSEVWASFDMRIWLRPDWNFTDIEDMLTNILQEAALPGPDNSVTINYILQSFEAKRTVADDTNPWWTVVQSTCQELGITCPAYVFSAATDGRYVRSVDIPVFGICPFPNTANTAHQVDESINETQFLRGIDRYVSFIRNLANVPREIHP